MYTLHTTVFPNLITSYTTYNCCDTHTRVSVPVFGHYTPNKSPHRKSVKFGNSLEFSESDSNLMRILIAIARMMFLRQK